MSSTDQKPIESSLARAEFLAAIADALREGTREGRYAARLFAQAAAEVSDPATSRRLRRLERRLSRCMRWHAAGPMARCAESLTYRRALTQARKLGATTTREAGMIVAGNS